MKSRFIQTFVAFGLILIPAVQADEGMWLFNQFPARTVARQYHFEVTQPWLDHLRLASVRFNNGGSGSFISPNGLLFTNHHVGSDCIQKLSSAQHDYLADGFQAANQSEERACPDLEVDVLVRIEDVTAKLNAAVQPGASVAEANQQRKAEMSNLEKRCITASGNRCEVVTLYSGGEYHLYEYKKYTDVRLVFAPEYAIAQFGGDPDNFTYPRYDLDFAFFRAYENGKPAVVERWLRWSHEGVKDGELTFVSGNPGSTGRLATYSELEFDRDDAYPLVHERLGSLIDALEAFGAQNPENKRVAAENLANLQNSYKAYTGFLAGLRDPALMKQKRESEMKLRSMVEAKPEAKKQYSKSWDEVGAAYQEYAKFYKQYWLLERGAVVGADMLQIARDIVRYTDETRKPNEQRLREFADSALPALEQEMYSPAPLSESMEVMVLTNYFRFLRKHLGDKDVAVKAVLNGHSPEEAARNYATTSKLADVAERKRLAASPQSVASSQDGMIRLARALDGPARRYRKMYDDQVEAVLTVNKGLIARARFAIYGASEYPDATFTLRLTYGPVIGYKDKAGRMIPYTTRFAGLYQRATGTEPYKLPQRWIDAKPLLDPKTPFDFATTTDTHGGNSGSPTVNEKNEIVGILFDGNIESLPNRFVYTEAQARSVHVASQAIIEALRWVYKDHAVLKEIGME